MMDVCKKWNAPMVVDIHGDAFFEYMSNRSGPGSRVRATLKFCRKIVCISENIRMLALKAGLEEDKLAFVPLGVDVDRFKPRNKGEIRRELAVSETNTVLYVGQLSRKKGVFDLLQAISLIKARGDTRFVIVGDGPEKNRLLRLSKNLGLEGCITFTGPLRGDKLLKWYSLADVFVLPSLSEGRPMVIYEAMASGCAIVGTRISGLPEQVKDNYNGFLVEPADPAMLAEKIERLINDPEEAARMGKNSRSRVFEERLTWGDYADKVKSLYRSLY
jgi:glycosyltransferase involved in cell wall biosynthesis